MSSTADAEWGGLYMNAQEAVPMRATLEELGHPQPPTPIRTDNSTADGIMNKTVKQKKSKSMDMRFWWLVDRVEQKQFKIFWAPGCINLADYYSKYHPPSHHEKVRPIYLYVEGKSPRLIQGCDKILLGQPRNTQGLARNTRNNINIKQVAQSTHLVTYPVTRTGRGTTPNTTHGTCPKATTRGTCPRTVTSRGITSRDTTPPSQANRQDATPPSQANRQLLAILTNRLNS